MKTILWLIVGGVFSFPTLSQENQREHLKCHIQLEDKSTIIHHFVNTKQKSEEFVEALTESSVFMADGVTEKKIIAVYECVDINMNFKSKKAITLEKNTPF